ncbi:MAG: hypothetical protein AB7P40_11675 [Chloroflexota bacterium]
MATSRERLHELLDRMPEDRLAEADAALTLLSAPDDDEPVTDEDLAAIREGREAYARGEAVTNDELKRRFGW